MKDRQIEQQLKTISVETARVILKSGFLLKILVEVSALLPRMQAATGGESSGGEYDLHRLLTIIYDDQNRTWYKQYMAGGSTVYQEKESGERVTIYSGEISGSGANTSMGYFHWY